MSNSEDSSAVGSPGYAHVNTFFECKDGISIGFITIVILGVLTMWYILYTKITMGRRKREALDDADNVDDIYVYTKAALLSGTFILASIALSFPFPLCYILLISL